MVATGRHTIERLSLANLASGASVEAIVHNYDGAHDGPTLYVQSAQHGFEVNGTAALRRFHYDLDLKDLHGTVIVVPVANPITFDQATRRVRGNIDSVHRDLNRVWPGRADGSVQERIADGLWTLAFNADYAIDLHTMRNPEAAPHVVSTKESDTSDEMAEAFGGDVLIRDPAGMDPEEFDVDSFKGKFRAASTLAGTPAITPELGHSRYLTEDIVEAGVTGIMNVLRYLDMLDGDPVENGRGVRKDTMCMAKTNHAGLFMPSDDLAPGEDVKAGELVGTLYHSTTYETLQKVTAPHDGVLLQLNTQATMTPGTRVAMFAHGDHPEH